MAETDIAAYLTGWNAPTFNGQPREDVQMWISQVRYGLKQRRVPRALWPAVAHKFLGEEPRTVLEGMRHTMMEVAAKDGQTEWEWDWDMFTRTLVLIHDQVKKDADNQALQSIGPDLQRFRREHPYAAAAAGLGLVAVGGITVGPAILVGTLHLLGLSASGVAVAAPVAVAVKAISAGTMALSAWVGFGGSDNTGAKPSADNPPTADTEAALENKEGWGGENIESGGTGTPGTTTSTDHPLPTESEILLEDQPRDDAEAAKAISLVNDTHIWADSINADTDISVEKQP